MQYIYQHKKWPHFQWKQELISTLLPSITFKQGKLLGKMNHLGFKLQEQAVIESLSSSIIKSSEIEGEELNPEEVRSSVARQLGIDIAGLLPKDRSVDGIVEIHLDATQAFNKALTKERLCHWHASLFPSGISGMMNVNPGQLRTDKQGTMQVISGAYGRERVHFQAPPAKILPKELTLFLDWFEQPTAYDLIIKAAIAHLWFVTLHPFDDGNGRIARAITDMVLAQSEAQKNRFYSMSAQIRKERKAYYDILEHTQKNDLDITEWLCWFLRCLERAIENSEALLKHILNKASFWEIHSETALNDRQIKMINLLFDGFKGKLTSSKWAKITKCSQDTASRDIRKLIEHKILVKTESGGRSTHYTLKNFPIHQINEKSA